MSSTTPPFPAFTTATCWECIGWNSFITAHNLLARPTTSKRTLRIKRFQDGLQQFLLESPLVNYWYQSGIEMAMDEFQSGDPHRPLVEAIEHQNIVAYNQLARTTPPCMQCAQRPSVLWVERIILYTETFCSVTCAQKYQRHRIQSDRWLRKLVNIPPAAIPEDSSEWSQFFSQLPALHGTCGFDEEYQQKVNEVKRPTLLQKVRPSHAQATQETTRPASAAG